MVARLARRAGVSVTDIVTTAYVEKWVTEIFVIPTLPTAHSATCFPRYSPPWCLPLFLTFQEARSVLWRPLGSSKLIQASLYASETLIFLCSLTCLFPITRCTVHTWSITLAIVFSSLHTFFILAKFSSSEHKRCFWIMTRWLGESG